MASSQPAIQVAVAPTETTLCTLDVEASAVVTVQVVNLDGTQTFSGGVRRRVRSLSAIVLPMTLSTLPDLASIGPGASACVDVDVGGNSDLSVVGSMSGAGGNVVVAVRNKVR